MDRSEEKFKDTFKLANPVNPWSGARIFNITVTCAEL